MNRTGSILLLSAVPAILAIGALNWLFFGEEAHKFNTVLSQEERRSVLVQASPRPRAPIKIILDDADGVVRVTRVEFDGSQGVVYAVNTGSERQCFLEVHATLLSPDRTVIGGESHYAASAEGGLLKGDKAEIPFEMKPDKRAATLRVRITYQTACG